MTKPPSSDTRPPYRRVADVLRQEIKAGRLKPGEQLPSHRELEARFEIANMTARSALRVLREEGLIHTVQGRGSYVLDPEGSGEVTPPAWYTANASATSKAEQEDAPLTAESLSAAFATHEPGSLNWPGASPEFNALAQQVHVLSKQVEQLTRVFHQVLETVQKPSAE